MLCGFCFVDLLRLVQCGGSEAASTLLLDQCHVIWECFWVLGLQQVAYVSSTYKCFITRSYVEMGWIVLIVMASVCDIIPINIATSFGSYSRALHTSLSLLCCP